MVTYDRDGPVAVIGIDRPDAKHAIDNGTALALGEAWRRFDDDEEGAVGVLTGDEEGFSAGADLKRMDLEDRDEGWLGFSRMGVSKPTTAAGEGRGGAGVADSGTAGRGGEPPEDG